jgi:hypothetical protein
MTGGSSQTQNASTTQQSTTQPWSEAQPLLKNLIGDYSAMNPAVTPEQQAALQNLGGAAASIPQWDADTLYSPFESALGFNTTNEQNELQGIPGGLASHLSDTVDQNNLNPMNTPGFSDALGTMNNDITNQVKSIYAGSGRDPTGAGSFAQSLGRGLSQGEGQLIENQFNQNRGAQNSAAEAIAGSQGTAATQTAALREADLNAQLQGLGYMPQALQDLVMPAQTMMQFANAGYGQPFQNLQDLLSPSLALGSMGSESSGTGTSTGTVTQSSSALGNILGGITGGLGLLGKFLPSDERVKDDIEEVGELHDGQKVYAYRYKGSPTTHLGLLAQEVLDHDPDAVDDFGGMLAVDYKRATRDAAAMGAHA